MRPVKYENLTNTRNDKPITWADILRTVKKLIGGVFLFIKSIFPGFDGGSTAATIPHGEIACVDIEPVIYAVSNN